MSKKKAPLLLRIVQRVFPVLEKYFAWLALRLFVWSFFKPLRYKPHQKEVEFMKSAETFSLSIDGKKIQGYAWGSGEVVWFVHGWAGRAGQFRKIIPHVVKAGFRAVAIDGPAHGKSDGQHTSILEFHQAFEKLIAHTGTPRVVINHSFGGVATLYSITQGLPIQRLVYIATPTIGNEIIKTFLHALHGSPKTGEAFQRYMKKTYGKTFDEFSALHFIQQIKSPLDILMVYDDHDIEVPLIHAQKFLAVFPSAQYEQTKGLGHNMILKDASVIEKVVAFCIKNQ